MASAGAYTPETQYFCRYFRLLVETGSNVLRKILTIEVSALNQTIEQFITARHHQLLTIKQLKHLSRKQYALLSLPTPNKINIEEWDVSLLAVVLHNCCNVRQLKQEINLLRDERNALCHSSKTCITQKDFQIKWTTVKNALKQILQVCKDRRFEKSILNEIQQLHGDPIDIGRTIDFFYEHMKNTYDSEEIKEGLEVVNSKAEDIQRNQRIQGIAAKETSKKVAILERKIDEIGFVLAKKSKYKVKKRFLRQDGPETLAPNIKALYKQTETVLETGIFAETCEFDKARHLLRDTGSVVICGGPGEGKTTLAYQLMRDSRRYENRCLQIFNPSEVHDIEPKTFSVIFIDRLFGYLNVNATTFSSWLPILDQLQRLVEAHAFKLIVVTDTLVFNECYESLTNFNIFKNKVNLDSRNLSKFEKRSILLASLKTVHKETCLSESDVNACIESSNNSDMSFPLLCRTFASRYTFPDELESCFRRKMLLHCNILHQLNDEQKETLLYVWKQGGRCAFKSHVAKRISEYSLVGRVVERPRYNLEQNIQILQGIFLCKNNDCYEFVSRSVYESVGLYFANNGFSKEVIEKSDFDFFMNSVRIEKDELSDVFVVSNVEQNLIAERVIIEVAVNKNIRKIISQPCLTNDVMDMIFNELIRSRRLHLFLLAEQENERGSCPFLQHALEQSLPSSNNFLEKVVQSVSCRKHRIKLKECKLCNMFKKALLGAIHGQNPLAVMTLRFVDFDEEDTLLEAVKVGNVAVYQVLSTSLKTSIRKQLRYQSSALLKSIDTCCEPIFIFILNQGCVPGIKCLMLASEKENTYFMLKKMINTLTHNDTKPISIDVQNEDMRKILNNLTETDYEDFIKTFSVIPTRKICADRKKRKQDR